jgi:hypothetical protein
MGDRWIRTPDWFQRLTRGFRNLPSPTSWSDARQPAMLMAYLADLVMSTILRGSEVVRSQPSATSGSNEVFWLSD